ncbi:MAG: DMT family transporter [Candidatus Omnitrophica bacterium]|nr:DMT family transporter [Candidatus Omnitrophota bacterium]MBU1929868.1 DMT family transporter [Candidatus Omnitrophota bacterium]MBU2034154.1 DMT family transporter [Candidatus Omnitrophota bacterium]MBU2258702.1 DMT family transporter [Candidatus Omnitrophota bacterium]
MIQPNQVYGILGGVAALASAAVWALGSILFRKIGEEVTPFGMNLCKGIIGLFYLSVVIILSGFQTVSTSTFLLLGASGILGITLGDTLFFKALIYLGPRLTVLLETMGSVFTVILAVVFLRERFSLVVWCGLFLTVTGVTWVLWDGSEIKKADKNWHNGIKYALLSALCMSLGIIFAKKVIESTSALQANFIRFLGGTIGIITWGLITKNFRSSLQPFTNPRLLKFTLLTVFVVIFGGFWLFLVALKYVDASIATILNSTTPLFILPMAVVFLKEKISFQAVIGAIIAVCGVILIFLK